MQTNAFAHGLIEDTANNTIFWSCVGEFGGYVHSIDFRADNKILETLTNKNPFIYNNWQDVYVTNVMSAFVYLAKTQNIPPKYYLYIQPDADSNLCLANCEQEVLKELFNTVTSHLEISFNKISDFLEIYFSQKSMSSSNDD